MSRFTTHTQGLIIYDGKVFLNHKRALHYDLIAEDVSNILTKRNWLYEKCS